MKRILLCVILLFVISFARAQETQVLYLSGYDKDNTVEWDFFCTNGMNSGKWSRIAVPSNWELQGFGSYLYGKPNLQANEKGLYKHEFTVSKKWKSKKVYIVFEGSMTDTEVKINGKLAGPMQNLGQIAERYPMGALIDAMHDALSGGGEFGLNLSCL